MYNKTKKLLQVHTTKYWSVKSGELDIYRKLMLISEGWIGQKRAARETHLPIESF